MNNLCCPIFQHILALLKSLYFVLFEYIIQKSVLITSVHWCLDKQQGFSSKSATTDAPLIPPPFHQPDTKLYHMYRLEMSQCYVLSKTVKNYLICGGKIKHFNFMMTCGFIWPTSKTLNTDLWLKHNVRKMMHVNCESQINHCNHVQHSLHKINQMSENTNEQQSNIYHQSKSQLKGHNHWKLYENT